MHLRASIQGIRSSLCRVSGGRGSSAQRLPCTATFPCQETSMSGRWGRGSAPFLVHGKREGIQGRDGDEREEIGVEDGTRGGAAGRGEGEGAGAAGLRKERQHRHGRLKAVADGAEKWGPCGARDEAAPIQGKDGWTAETGRGEGRASGKRDGTSMALRARGMIFRKSLLLRDLTAAYTGCMSPAACERCAAHFVKDPSLIPWGLLDCLTGRQTECREQNERHQGNVTRRGRRGATAR